MVIPKSQIKSSFLSASMKSSRSEASFVRETASLLALANDTQAAHVLHPSSSNTYKDMRPLYYYPATLLLFTTEALLATAIPEVDVVFNFLSAIAISCLGFLFPSAFFLGALRICKSESVDNDRLNFHKIMAYLHIILGVLILSICLTPSILSLIF